MSTIRFYTLLLLSAAGLFQAARAASWSPDSAIIEIRDIRDAGDPILLLYRQGDEATSQVIEAPQDGVYRFSVPVEGHAIVDVMVRNSQNMLIQGGSFRPKPRPSLLVRPGSVVHIQIDSDDYLNLELQSTDEETAYYEHYSRQERVYLQKSWEQTVRRETAGADSVMKSSAEKALGELRESFEATKKAFVAHSWDRLAGLEVFATYYMGLDPSEARDALYTFSPDLRKLPLWKKIEQNITAAGQVAVGQTIPSFSVPTKDGGVFSSDQLGGNYWLLDFWGSWCQPCRAGHTELKRIYETYNSRGFEILGIAQEPGNLEKQREQWLRAIEEDGIDWVHTLNSTDNDLVQLFGITSYPTKILVDPTGKIVYRSGSSDADLEEILADALGQ